MLLWLLWVWLFGAKCPQRHRYRRVEKSSRGFRRQKPKPAWVRHEIVRLKALLPGAGCRNIAATFNRRFGVRKRMTVGKSYVADMIRNHRYEIEVLRRQIKNVKPRALPRNLVWAMDLTGKTDITGRTHVLLGLLECGSRVALVLAALAEKSSWALLGHLFLAIDRYGKPRMIKTDNEAVFTSKVFRLALFLFGIRHHRIDPGCPWQNGRIERFFGSLKEKLDRLAVDSFDALNAALGEFRFFYNHVRSHQNLKDRTPAEAWAGIDPYAAKVSGEYWFEAWDGLLKGYYLRR